MATPAAGSPGDNKAFIDGTAIAVPFVVDATHNDFKFNSNDYVIAQYGAAIQGTAVTLPVTIDASHNEFGYNSQQYIIATGVYKRLSDLAHAVNASIQVGDSSRFDAAIVATAKNKGLLFTSIATTNLNTFTTGSSNDCLTKLGLANSNALAAVGYPSHSLLVAALNAALLSGTTRLDTVLVASKSPFTNGAIRFTAKAAGVNTQTLATGTTNSALAALGFSNGAALAGGAAAISTGRTFDTTLTANQTPATAVKVAGNADPLVWAAVPTLQASWANKTGYQAAQFSKDKFGLVRLRGVIDTGTKTAGTTIFTLAAGNRPQAKCVFQVSPEVDATSNNSGEVVIDTDGTVKVGGTALTASSYISLAGIVFDTLS